MKLPDWAEIQIGGKKARKLDPYCTRVYLNVSRVEDTAFSLLGLNSQSGFTLLMKHTMTFPMLLGLSTVGIA